MLSFLASFISFTDQVIYALVTPGIVLGLAAIAASLFLPSFAYKIPAMAIGIGLVLFFTFYAGKEVENRKLQLVLTEQALEIASLEAAAANITTDTVVMYVDRVKTVEKIKTEFKTVYVDKFITPEIDAKFPLPNGFVILHDYAVRVETPPAPNDSSNQISSIPLSSATAVITSNYLTCKKTEIQLESLQNWIRDQQRLYNSDNL
jgi:hypothetical protein